MSEATEVRVERRGATEIWTIDRPAQRNALSRGVVREIGRLAREAAKDADVRAIVLTGSGDKAFCSGADLKERRTMSEADIRDFLALYRTEFRFVDELPKPVIAAIDGVAFGGGLELALACDLRVMASHAEIGLTEVSLGIVPGAGGTQRLTKIVGPAKAKELLLLSRRLGPDEALALGLVNRVAPAGSTALECALEWTAVFERGAPIAIAAALAAVDAAVDLPLAEGLTEELRCYERTLVSEDRVEALAAFAEKRAPVFRGR